MPSSPDTVASVESVALIGNPNTGKTTLFNALTGLSQRVGNYPGVTVERKTGKLELAPGRNVELVDLPGAYSLAASSPDQMIAADVLLRQQPGAPPIDVVVAIVDASNLRRNLYLVSQLMELDVPLVVALNMTDVASSRGIDIDAAALSERLGVSVIPMCAHRREGMGELRGAILDALGRDSEQNRAVPTFPESLERQVEILRASTTSAGAAGDRPLSRVEAFRALIDEGGYGEERLVAERGNGLSKELARRRGEVGVSAPLSSIETEVRYSWINRILEGCLSQTTGQHQTVSDKIDLLLTHRLAGMVIFIAVSAFVFQGIYQWSEPFLGGINSLFFGLSSLVTDILPAGALRSLIVDGIIGGVGGVILFLPQIAILFLFIAVLEDCGYMSRAALLMDRLLSRCGLSGTSFIPLLSSFACAVPGIMAARTIGDRRDRIATILVAPLMSCSARLPVYVLFIGAFIPDRPVIGGWLGLQGLTLLAMYSVGTVLAVPIAWILKSTLLRGDTPSFLLELPSYKWPDPATVALRVYHSGRAFIVRAGSIILAATIVMWALAYFPRSQAVIDLHQEARSQLERQDLAGEAYGDALHEIDRAEAAQLLESSILGRAGHLIEPVVKPLGWDWRIGMAAIASFPAREVVISVLGTIYSMGGDHDETSTDLRNALGAATDGNGNRVITVPVALSVMIFFALCAQCMSTLAVIQRETGSWKWAALAFAYMTLLAYVGALVTYQGATFLGWGG